MEAELEIIKNKLKNDDYDISNIEKKLLKLEKNLNKIENNFNNSDTESDTDESNKSDQNSQENYDIMKIIKDIDILEKKISNMSSDETLENLIEIYKEFKNKLNSIKLQNENFKLSIEYL